MSAACRRGAGSSQGVVEQSRIFVERGREMIDRRLAPFVHELRQLLKTVRVLLGALPTRNRGGNRSPMLSEAVAQRSGGAKGAQGSERASNIAREPLGRSPDRKSGVVGKECRS